MNNILDHLKNAGYKSSIVSIEHLPDLRSDLENLLKQGTLSRDFYSEMASRYFDFPHTLESPANFPEAKSIIITAAQQPKISVTFEFSGKSYKIIIPPIYVHETDEEAFNTISQYLHNKGYSLVDANVPLKSLAVHCGLATFGKNNIAYIDDWGSYFRLKAFYSDIPCDSIKWQEFKMMDLCSKCTACSKKCPTNAITEGRFLIRAERCITYFNEGSDEFPNWVDPTWHNCLIGCMICQDVCPANKDYKKWITAGGEFSDEETRMILEGVQRDKLPLKIIDKLKRLNMWDDYNLLQRNLSVLITHSCGG